ncbi:MAG: hypothetical protein JSW12_18250 [Deltaproteobacteria bacterium]|nr:MAG: hypothetical protein JSW12_18250 [Deltaproteobacteria bacterium]
MNIVNEVGDIAVVVYSFRREGDKLVMDGKALGTMRMDMIVTAEEALKGLKIALSWQAVSFVLLLPCFWLRNWVGRIFKKG